MVEMLVDELSGCGFESRCSRLKSMRFPLVALRQVIEHFWLTLGFFETR